MDPDNHLPHPPPNGFDLPRRLRRLADLAYNLWWTWHAESSRIFRYIDADTWERTEHNPVRFLRLVPSERVRAATNSRWLLEFYDRVVRDRKTFAWDEATRDFIETPFGSTAARHA